MFSSCPILNVRTFCKSPWTRQLKQVLEYRLLSTYWNWVAWHGYLPPGIDINLGICKNSTELCGSVYLKKINFQIRMSSFLKCIPEKIPLHCCSLFSTLLFPIFLFSHNKEKTVSYPQWVTLRGFIAPGRQNFWATKPGATGKCLASKRSSEKVKQGWRAWFHPGGPLGAMLCVFFLSPVNLYLD